MQKKTHNGCDGDSRLNELQKHIVTGVEGTGEAKIRLTHVHTHMHVCVYVCMYVCMLG